MPALKKTFQPSAFAGLKATRDSFSEKNDCTVVALALATGLPYAVCHKALADQGRKPGKGAFDFQWKAAAKALGFELRRWTSAEMVAMVQSYPKKGIAGITTHQPRRFPKCWANTGKLILHSRRHVSACINGEVQDWAINNSKQVHAIYEVLPIEA